MKQNHHAANGAAFERRVMERLLADGWDAVWRTAGSKGMGDVDLIAVRRLMLDRQSPVYAPWLVPVFAVVQCKGGARSLSGPAKRRFAEYAARIGAHAMVAERGLKFDWLRVEPRGVAAQKEDK